ncbi:hypothetical protein D3C73_1499770 [compost metagenome]
MGLAVCQVNDAVEQRVAAGCIAVEPVIEVFALSKRAVSQVIPEFWVGFRALEHLPEVFPVSSRIEFLQTNETSD